MRIWMIHEVTEKETSIIGETLSPEKDILIWDDAVISQYYAIKELKHFRNILGVSSNIANHTRYNKSRTLYEPTSVSHEKWHKYNDSSAFMTWENIRELSRFVEIAAHGYNHTHIGKGIDSSSEFMHECELIKEDFLRNLGFPPKTYIYPYNESTFWSETILHKVFNWKTYGKERLNINRLLVGEVK